MAYVKQNFVDGNVLTAAQLNHIEDGISNVTDTAYVKPSGGIPASDIASNAISIVYSATLNTTWTGSEAPYTKTQSINGILESDKPIVDLVPSTTYNTAEEQLSSWGYIYKITTAANSITLYATEKPTVSLPIQLLCVRK